MRLVRTDGAPRATATVVVVGPRSGVNDQLTYALVDSVLQVLQIDSTESLRHVMDAFPISALIFSAKIPRLQIARLIDSMKDRVERPELFAVVTNALDGAWLSHFGVTSVPEWSGRESLRGAVLRSLERLS